jgi:cytochrome b561
MNTSRYLRTPSRRTVLKILHWGIVPLFFWFVLVQPRDVMRWGTFWVDLHSVFGLVFVSGTLMWFTLYLRKGLASRPGRKLQGWARKVHRPLHITLMWGLFGVAVTGFLLGLTSSVQLWAGDIVPIAYPMGWPKLNDLVGIVHSIEFYTIAVLAIAHAGFHIWRHIKLRDNALRIMAPKVFHRYL